MTEDNDNKITFRQAQVRETEDVVDLYYYVIDHKDDFESGVKWTKDVYPSRQDIGSAVADSRMHVGLNEEGRIVCAFVLSGDSPVYGDIDWPTEAAPDEIAVIHLLTVHPDFLRRGLARRMVVHAEVLSRAAGKKVIRLDVLKENTPAEKLYLKCGFSFVAEKQIFYEDTGLTDFRMFEKVL